jgi:hypothetical protein
LSTRFIPNEHTYFDRKMAIRDELHPFVRREFDDCVVRGWLPPHDGQRPDAGHNAQGVAGSGVDACYML